MEHQEGRAEGILIAIHELMDSMKWPTKQAMDALKISTQDQKKYMSML